MPEFVKFLPHSEILTFEEIERVVQVAARLGVNKIRLTGGEPLVRGDVWKLIQMISQIDAIDDVALTTNGLLLADQAAQLRAAGLDRLNISLDSIDPEMYRTVTRRNGVEKVLAGIAEAQRVGFQKIRLNAVSIKGLTESEIIPMALFAREHALELRFIEFMPLDGDAAWDSEQLLTGAQVRSVIERELGTLHPAPRPNPQQPAVDYQWADGSGTIGFIDSVSQPFCGSCNRMRMTAEGKFRNCLFSTAEWDLRGLLRSGATEAQIEARIRECVAAKKKSHGIDSDDFQRPQKSMYQIGG